MRGEATSIHDLNLSRGLREEGRSLRIPRVSLTVRRVGVIKYRYANGGLMRVRYPQESGHKRPAVTGQHCLWKRNG